MNSLNAASKQAGATILLHEKIKINHSEKVLADQNIRLIPLVMETMGGLSSSFTKLLNKICRISSVQKDIPYHEESTRQYQRLSILLQKHIGMQIVSRSEIVNFG